MPPLPGLKSTAPRNEYRIFGRRPMFTVFSRQVRMSRSIQAEIERLRDEINRHSYLYYIEARPEISDLDFDHLLQRLIELETQHPQFDSPDSPSHKVGGAPIEGFASVTHRLPMLSIDNVYDEAGIREFGVRIRKLLEPGEHIDFDVEYK